MKRFMLYYELETDINKLEAQILNLEDRFQDSNLIH